MNINQFKRRNEPTQSADKFELENPYTLDVDVNGSIMAKVGAMVSYDGELSFTGKASAEGGIKGLIKETTSNEGTPIMEVEGNGHIYLADQKKEVQILELGQQDSMSVNGEDVLAFESQVTYSINTIDSLAGMFAGGLTNVYLEGPGRIAITTHGDPIVHSTPITTDPSATVAWSGTTPEVKMNKNLSDMIGQSSGERYQMKFTDSNGFVVVQPFEEQQQ